MTLDSSSAIPGLQVEPQAGVERLHAMSGAVIGPGCRSSVLRWSCADALQVPYRTDACSAGNAGAGVRVRPGGVQRRIASPQRGLPRRCEAVGQSDPIPGDNPSEDHQRAGVVGRGPQRGVGAVSERLAGAAAQLFRLSIGQATRSQVGPSAHEIAKGPSTVISADSQRIQSPCQRTLVCGENWRHSSALVSRAAERTVECHDHPRTGRPLLREFCRRCSRHATAGGGSGGRYGCRPHSVGDDRHYRRDADGHCKSEALGSQVTQTAAVGAGEVPPAERISQQTTDAAQSRHHAQSGSAQSARLSPQAGFGVGSREPSAPRRGPQHRGYGRQPSPLSGNKRCRVGSVCADPRRESRPLRPYRVPLSRWLASSKMCSTCGHRLQTNWAYRSVSGQCLTCGAFTIATTTPPRSFSPPGGRRD